MTMVLGMSAQESIELTSAEAKTLYKATTKRRVSVHDPSVVFDSISGNNRYYIIGSHRGVAYTTDMQNWTGATETFARVKDDGSIATVATNGNQMEANLRLVFSRHRTTTVPKGGEQVAFGNYDAQAWCRAIPDATSGDWDVNGVMWAPDMVWNPVMQKWCQYLSLNGNDWASVIVLLTADKLTGPWVYEGPVVFSGFRTGTDERVSWKKTDLELVIGEQSSLPSRYNHPSKSNGQMWGDWWPNNIDPCVFYDEEGELWMAYGSWSGGIWMLKLNKENGLRDYDVTYTSDYASKGKQCTSDPYFGKRIAGGCYVSGEGPYIEHIGQYYYLFMSYGGFAPDGGYEMRVFRSEKPDGPYKDASGRSAQFTSWVLNYGGANADKRGEKIFGSYNGWGFQTVGECAQGHNSIIAAGDGRTYLVYHTKFNDGTYGHQVRVHQVFLNKDGWLVAAPFEYNGEQLTDADMARPTPLSTSDIVGTYQILIHKYAMDHNNMEEVTPVEVTLADDGRVSGKYVGTWSIEEGTSYLTIRLGTVTYKGVIFEETMDQQSTHAVSFTACAPTGVNVWGYKMHPKYALAWQLNNQKMPVSNYASVKANLNLDGIWQGDANVSVQWTSSHPDIISEHGRYNPTGLQEDTEVTLTARIASGNYYWQQEYKVKALSEVNAAPTADWQTGMLAHYGFDDEALANTFNTTETASLLRKSTTKLPTLADDEPLRTGRYVHLNVGANGKESYVSMPNPLYGKELSDGATIAFWVKRTDANLWDALFGLANGDARLYLTGNLYVGYNDGAGKWLDINNPERVKPTQLGTGAWHFVTVTFERKATSTTGGVMLYIDGNRKTGDNFKGEIDGKAITNKAGFDYNLFVDHLAASPDLYLGNGSFWGSPDVCIDDVVVYDAPLSLQQVMALYSMENRAFDFHTLTAGIVEVKHDAQSASQSVFSLSGLRLGTSTQHLPRGLYIVNGKKVVVK